MRKLILTIATAASVTAATAVGAQEPTEAFGGLDDATAAQLVGIVQQLRAKQLPVEPVVAKARRGALIHTPPTRIVAAARAVADRLEAARDALGADASPTDLAAGADALGTPGITRDMLQLLRVADPHAPVAVPIGVLTQLVASGVAPTQAADIMGKLVRANATNAQLVALGNDVNQDVVAGAAAMASLETRLQTLRPLLTRTATAHAATTLAVPAGKP